MDPHAPTPSRRRERQLAMAAIDLYPVTCEELSAGRSDLDVLRGCLAGGARIVQLRDKRAGKRALLAKAEQFRELTAAAGALLIVNDHVDIALAVGADGVHLGQDDLPLTVARRLLPEQLIGVSSHSLEEALAAQADGADYVNIGPIFPTRTKDGLPTFLGPGAIGRIAPRLQVPWTCMGGINAGNLDQVLALGARRIAVVTAVTQAPDVAGAVRELRRRILAAGA